MNANMSRVELGAVAGRELTDAELEAIAAGKEILSKIDPGFSSGRGLGGMFAANTRRPLPERGGRLAANVNNLGQGFA